MRSGRFVGALVGVIALGENNLISPTFRENLPHDTDAVLIDQDAEFGTPGRVIYPPGRPRVVGGSGWAQAIAAASQGASGTLIGEAGGQRALRAVGAGRVGVPGRVVRRPPLVPGGARRRRRADVPHHR